MRVAFLNNSFLHYSGPLASAVARAGDDVLYIATSDAWDFAGGPDPKGEFREILDPAVVLEWVDVPSDTNLLTLGANMRCIARMARLIREFKPDILHAHDIADYRYLAAVALSKRMCPVVLTVHNAEPHLGKKDNKMEFMRPWLRRMADEYIVHGLQIRDRLVEIHRMPADRIHLAAIGAYMFHRKWMTGIQNDGRKVLFFGGIFKYKGLDYLIKAAPIVCAEIPDAKFVIAGKGPDWPRCKELIGNSPCFEVHEERVTNPEVTRLFEESAVVVLPYIEASQSGVIGVAYALGKPVIATSVGALPEVVDEGETGLIVPPADEKALAEAIIRVLKDKDLRERMGAGAYKKASEGDLSWDTIAEKNREVYRIALSRRNGKK